MRTTVAPTVDPLREVVLAGSRLRDRVHPPVFQDWVSAVRERLHRRDPALRLLHVPAPLSDHAAGVGRRAGGGVGGAVRDAAAPAGGGVAAPETAAGVG